MKPEIKITKTSQSRISSLDFNNIPFGKIFADHMFVADYKDGQWTDAKIVPFEPVATHPGNLAWHYGQAIFEGMKVSKSKSGHPLLFRPELHVERLNASARRMCMVEVPEDLFLEGLKQLVALDVAWIPPQEGSALYIRPLLYATDESIGVRASDNYKFVIMTLPVGTYYNKPVKLLADPSYVRAVVGGVGEAKTAGNYAASLMPASIARQNGFDQILWLDAIHHKFVQEVGTMNIFFVINDHIITPKLDGAILRGITRDSIIKVLRGEGYHVTERVISIDEIVIAANNGSLKEVFGAGTAAVVSEVSHIKYLDHEIVIDTSKYKIAHFVKNTINKLRVQEIEDKYNWLSEVK